MKNYVKKTALVILTLIALAAAGVLVFTGLECKKAGYDEQLLRDVLEKKSYVETEDYKHQASEAIYDAMEMVAVSSKTGYSDLSIYQSGKIVCIREYLEDGRLYDSVSQGELGNDIYYYLNDLYKWSQEEIVVQDGIFWENYKPLYYGSIQEYCNMNDQAYNTVVSQIRKILEAIRSKVENASEEMEEYQAVAEKYAYDATNVRYALLDVDADSFYTNVTALQGTSPDASLLTQYFCSFGSYYIYDHNTGKVLEQNIGDYFAYNTPELLENYGAQLSGNYQVFVSIDTNFPVKDSIAERKQSYEEAGAWIIPHVRPVATSLVILVFTAIVILVIFLDAIYRLIRGIWEHLHAAAQITLCFAAYTGINLLLLNLPGKWVFLTIWNIIVLAVILADAMQRQQIINGIEHMSFEEGEKNTKLPTEKMFPENRKLAEEVNALGDHLWSAVQDQMKSERMKADLITNVSHDLKTPLTSIINYVDLMKREPIENDKVRGYLEVLDKKSQRLKQLTEDLVEASRASSGNVTLNIETLDMKELLMQTCGEFEERFVAKRLHLVKFFPNTPVYVQADGRRLWRIIENLFRNVEKYAMPGTRVYLEVGEDEENSWMSLKNISEQPLNISVEELTERFTRGDESRTTEGSGLGLSIAKDLTRLQNGVFDISLDGDLFKVTVSFPKTQETEN